MAIQLLRRRFNVKEFHRMAQTGILTEDDRVELLDGELVEMTPIGSRHAACVNRLAQFFAERLASRAIVSVQNPVQLGPQSEPQPDIALLRPRADYYAGSHPEPQHVLLLIEVTDTSMEVDRQIKVPLYARAGIPEVWLVDIGQRHVDIYQNPSPQEYREIRRLGAGQSLTVPGFPDLTLPIDRILV
jgi:Uma2 family endonuclease